MRNSSIYYWYDHLMLRGGCEILGIYLDTDTVQDAIEKHDWNRFRLYRFLCDELDHYSMRDKKMTFFPDHTTAYTCLGGF